MLWLQKQVRLKARTRGFHLITSDILAALPELTQLETGLLHLWLQHTSASLSINENASPEVCQDFEQFFNRLVPEGQPYYRHTDEGDDDLPAHIKSSVLGCQLSLPVSHGRLTIGTWQGIYLGEHRDHASSRRVVVTLSGQASASLV